MKNRAVPILSSSARQAVRRLAEVVLAALLLALSWPIILLSMLAVRLTSRGSPLYFQERSGLRGRRIIICKIRTMRHDCERESGAVWSTPGDVRVTPVGRFLRRIHVDELPQLMNVLRGDMSLVGPRPERPEIIAQLEAALPHYRRRLDVLPGLTGLAQVLQGPDADLGTVSRKLELDFHYIERRCLSLDVKILLATALHVIDHPVDRIARFLQVPIPADAAGAPTVAADPKPETVSIEATFAG